MNDMLAGLPDTSSAQRNEAKYHLLLRVAGVAMVFSLVVVALLLYDHHLRQAKDPHESVALKALKAALKQQPTNTALKEEIRTLDKQLNEEYFRQRAFTAFGTWMLLGGVVLSVAAAGVAVATRPQLPAPAAGGQSEDIESGWTHVARWSVIGLGGLLILAAAGLGKFMRTSLPPTVDETPAVAAVSSDSPRLQPTSQQPASQQATSQHPSAQQTTATSQGKAPAAVAAAPPSAEEIAKMWPRFRGPAGNGVSAFTNVPDSWDDKTGKNILWKTEVPLPGKNSPVVWGDQVFLSGATADKREVYAFDAKTGALQWQQQVTGSAPAAAEPPEVTDDTGYAAPTTTTDGRQVYAVFANGDVAAFSVAGKKAWVRSLGTPDNSYGHAASLLMFKNLLIVPFDQAGKKDGKSKLLALDVASGKTVWEAPREVPNSWYTPILINYDGRDQIITAADPWVIAYKPDDGKELWRIQCLRGDCGVSPVYAGGLIQVGNEYCRWFALKPDGTGDVTKTHIAWKAEDGLPDTCSPLATEKYVLLLTTQGTLTCYDATNGELKWEKDFDNAICMSSPSLVGDRVYLFATVEEDDPQGALIQKGITWIMPLGDAQPEVISESKLEEGCVTSPAFQDGRIYVRGEKHLYCIGQK